MRRWFRLRTRVSPAPPRERSAVASDTTAAFLAQITERFGDRDIALAVLKATVRITSVEYASAPPSADDGAGRSALVQWVHRTNGALGMFGPSDALAAGKALEDAFKCGEAEIDAALVRYRDLVQVWLIQANAVLAA